MRALEEHQALSRVREVTAQRVHRLVRVALLERGDDGEVLVHGMTETRRGGDDPDLHDALVEHLQHAAEGRVAGALHDEPVAPRVGLEERLVRLWPDGAPPELAQGAIEPLESGAVDSVRRQPARGRL